MDSNFQNRINFQNLENKGFRQESRQYNDTGYKKTFNKNYNQNNYGGNNNYYKGFDDSNSDNSNNRYTDR
jgi:hypothetical protein